MDAEHFWSHLEQYDDLTQWDDQDAALAEQCLRLVEAVRAEGGSRADERRAILFVLGAWYEPGSLQLAYALTGIMDELADAVQIYTQARQARPRAEQPYEAIPC